MALRVEQQGGVPVLVIEGRLEDEHVDELIATATQWLEGPGAALVCDLRAMNYVNSSGLGGLIRLAAQANTQRQRVVLAGPTQFMRDLLTLTRLDKFFETATSVEEALARLKTPPRQ